MNKSAKYWVAKKLCAMRVNGYHSLRMRESEHFMHITAVKSQDWVTFQIPLAEFNRLVALEEIL